MKSRNVETFHNMKELKRNDIIFTPNALAKRCIDLIPFKEGDIALDPARGTGAFYNNFPGTVQAIWCEFDEIDQVTVYKEDVPVEGKDTILENYTLTLEGNWSKEMVQWLTGKLLMRLAHD